MKNVNWFCLRNIIVFGLCVIFVQCKASKLEPVDPTADTSQITADELSLLNASPSSMTTEEMLDYLSYDPLLAYRCNLPGEESFSEIADALGGFSRPYQISVAEDATDPRILSGFEQDVYILESDSAEIERPDLVGSEGNMALYLSKPLGLFVVEVNETDPFSSQLSCSATLPGAPLNFILKNNQLLVFINSIDGKQGAVFKYTVAENKLTYHSGLFLENMPIVDARLFDATLAIYSQDVSDETSSDNYALTIVSTDDELTLTSQDNLVYDEEVDAYGTVSHWSRYSSFVSASNDYLVISRTDDKKYIDHYETKSVNYCTAFEEKTRKVCHTIWEKIENPDYVDYGTSTISCGSDLLSCLVSKGPSLSRYIYVNAGSECEDQNYYSCVSYKTSTITYPVYEDVITTQFTIYRYENGDFVRLDDTLSVLDGESLTVTENPIQVSGEISEHSWLYFQDGFFYALSSERQLTTFSIQGNSVIQTSVLEDIGGSGDTISAAQFSPQALFVNIADPDSDTYDRLNFSTLSLISLSDPVMPAMSGDVSLAGDLYQLFVLDDLTQQLLAFGSAQYGSGLNMQTVGTINLFGMDGVEQDNLLLGIDYTSFSTSAASDDQVARFDETLNRLILPYTSSGFVNSVGYVSKYRLTLTDVESDHLEEKATFEFDALMKRSLSFNENLALTFSDYFIYLLYDNEGWADIPLMETYLPKYVYEVDDTYWIRVTDLGASRSFAVVPADDIFSETPVDDMTLAKASAHVCVSEQLYFADNGFLLVSEKTGLYADTSDCPSYDTVEVELQGWHVNEDGAWEETDARTLQTAYDLVLADYQCVVDITNFDGEVLDVDEVPEGATCYTREEYDAMRFGY